MAVIEAIGVTKAFNQLAVRVDAVRGIDLPIEQGEMVAIVGPSGSGKSTLLSVLGAIDAPTSGQVMLEGVDLASLDDNQRTLLRRRRIGFVFQAYNLLPTLTALHDGDHHRSSVFRDVPVGYRPRGMGSVRRGCRRYR